MRINIILVLIPEVLWGGGEHAAALIHTEVHYECVASAELWAAHHVSHLPSCGLCREVGLGEEEVGLFTAQMSLMCAMCED